MKQLTAYCPNAFIPDLTEKHLKQFDRLNLAFVVLKNGKLNFDNLANITEVPRIREANPDLRILMSVGGAGAGGFSNMALTAEGRADFARQCVEAIEHYDLDGMDLDWEFPGSDYGMDHSPLDKPNFTALLKTVREHFDAFRRPLDLTIAAGAGQWFMDQTEVEKYHVYLDQIMLMTYDLRGFGQKLTGHHTALYTKPDDAIKLSADSAVKDWLAVGVPADKIAIGSGFYSRVWYDVVPENNGLLREGRGGDFGENYNVLRDQYVNKQGFKRYWDDTAKVPWLFDGETFITYDDPESVQAKCDYVNEHGLAGIFFWRYLNDPDNELIPIMREAMDSQ